MNPGKLLEERQVGSGTKAESGASPEDPALKVGWEG